MRDFISDDMPEKGMGGRMLLFFSSYKVTKLQSYNAFLRKIIT